MEKYEDMPRGDLVQLSDEGWQLANKRTQQLREAVEALRVADRFLESRGSHLEANADVNLKKMYEVLAWAKQMFPE